MFRSLNLKIKMEICRFDVQIHAVTGVKMFFFKLTGSLIGGLWTCSVNDDL